MEKSVDRFKCNNCLRKTNHECLAYHEESKHKGGEIWLLDEYITSRCLGCGSISFIHRNTWPTDDETETKVSIYPPRVARPMPTWIEDFDDLLDLFSPRHEHEPEACPEIKKLMEESYTALQNNSGMLAAMGGRALLERLMLSKIEDQGSFANNVQKFHAEGFASDLDAQVILGRRLISSQPDTNGRELDHGHVIRGQLVVARGDAAEVFDLVEEAFHEVARLVEMGAEADRVLAV